MKKMIDEKRLIEELSKNSIFEKVTVGEETVFDIIDKQPKVGEWIPCSELPQYTGEYNVTVGIASEFGYYEKVTTLRFERIKGEEPRWVIPDRLVYRVIAWMPLPKPYQEE